MALIDKPQHWPYNRDAHVFNNMEPENPEPLPASGNVKKGRRVSIKDIARLAGVSHSTVSRALRGSSLVNGETTAEIQRIADEHGFRVSAVARSLATSRTNTFGIVVTSISDPFVAEVVSAIESQALAHDYSVFLANSQADPVRELKVVQSLEARRVDGIVVVASRVGALYGDEFERMGIPIVLLNNQHPSQFAHSVIIDNLEGARSAVNHLINLGHRDIAYLGDRLGYSSDTERFSGYRSALDAADIPFEPSLVVHGDGKAEGGFEATARLLQDRQAPTAVVCYNDMTALGALKAIRAHGLKVPADISIVGFDDLPLALYTDPPLTTIHQPKQEMGRLAVNLLLQLIAGEHEGHDIRAKAHLVIRESTAAPRNH